MPPDSDLLTLALLAHSSDAGDTDFPVVAATFGVRDVFLGVPEPRVELAEEQVRRALRVIRGGWVASEGGALPVRVRERRLVVPKSRRSPVIPPAGSCTGCALCWRCARSSSMMSSGRWDHKVREDRLEEEERVRKELDHG